jgi:phosphoribosylanthranilate isomerase
MIYDNIDYVLFDTYSKAGYGGTGESFDWDIIKGYKKPFFLAGGLNYGNIVDAINSTHPYCVDISSGVETKGAKDRHKIIDIVNLVRSVK